MPLGRERIGGEADVIAGIILITRGTSVLNTAIGEAIGDPHEGDTTSEDPRSPTQEIAVVIVYRIAEAKAGREEWLEGRKVVIGNTMLLGQRRAVECCVSCRTVYEERHIDT